MFVREISRASQSYLANSAAILHVKKTGPIFYNSNNLKYLSSKIDVNQKDRMGQQDSIFLYGLRMSQVPALSIFKPKALFFLIFVYWWSQAIFSSELYLFSTTRLIIRASMKFMIGEDGAPPVEFITYLVVVSSSGKQLHFSIIDKKLVAIEVEDPVYLLNVVRNNWILIQLLSIMFSRIKIFAEA